jgi:hypothetical protein
VAVHDPAGGHPVAEQRPAAGEETQCQPLDLSRDTVVEHSAAEAADLFERVLPAAEDGVAAAFRGDLGSAAGPAVGGSQ